MLYFYTICTEKRKKEQKEAKTIFCFLLHFCFDLNFNLKINKKNEYFSSYVL